MISTMLRRTPSLIALMPILGMLLACGAPVDQELPSNPTPTTQAVAKPVPTPIPLPPTPTAVLPLAPKQIPTPTAVLVPMTEALATPVTATPLPTSTATPAAVQTPTQEPTPPPTHTDKAMACAGCGEGWLEPNLKDVLYEAVFEPVTIATGGETSSGVSCSPIGADVSYGLLRPMWFRDDDGAVVTIRRIQWKPLYAYQQSGRWRRAGSIEIDVAPRRERSNYDIDFIRSTSDSYRTENTGLVDPSSTSGYLKAAPWIGQHSPCPPHRPANRASTLSWFVGSQPWGSGDEMTIWIRKSLLDGLEGAGSGQTDAGGLL